MSGDGFDYVREPQTGLYARVRAVPGVVMDGQQVWGVEIAEGVDGPWQAERDVLARTARQALDRVRMRIRDRFVRFRDR